MSHTWIIRLLLKDHETKKWKNSRMAKHKYAQLFICILQIQNNRGDQHHCTDQQQDIMQKRGGVAGCKCSPHILTNPLILLKILPLAMKNLFSWYLVSRNLASFALSHHPGGMTNNSKERVEQWNHWGNAQNHRRHVILIN